jgi:hypothetical protein
MGPDGTAFLMPVDPQGQGSWIAVNEYGLSLCLLNYYQGNNPRDSLISRGLLIKRFAAAVSSDALLSRFQLTSFAPFAPFTLVVFDSALSEHSGKIHVMQWDGDNLTEQPAVLPLVSSAVRASEVTQYRRSLFADSAKHATGAESTGVKSNAAERSRLTFHRSYHPQKSYLSPCMSRSDARTVSFTHIRVTTEEVSIRYQQSAPCSDTPFHHQCLNRAPVVPPVSTADGEIFTDSPLSSTVAGDKT